MTIQIAWCVAKIGGHWSVSPGHDLPAFFTDDQRWLILGEKPSGDLRFRAIFTRKPAVESTDGEREGEKDVGPEQAPTEGNEEKQAEGETKEQESSGSFELIVLLLKEYRFPLVEIHDGLDPNRFFTIWDVDDLREDLLTSIAGLANYEVRFETSISENILPVRYFPLRDIEDGERERKVPVPVPDQPIPTEATLPPVSLPGDVAETKFRFMRELSIGSTHLIGTAKVGRWDYHARLDPVPWPDQNGKYLLFSQDRGVLMELGMECLLRRGFRLIKIPSVTDKVGQEFVLAVFDDHGYREMEIAQLAEENAVFFANWKSEQATQKGVYSETYVRNLERTREKSTPVAASEGTAGTATEQAIGPAGPSESPVISIRTRTDSERKVLFEELEQKLKQRSQVTGEQEMVRTGTSFFFKRVADRVDVKKTADRVAAENAASFRPLQAFLRFAGRPPASVERVGPLARIRWEATLPASSETIDLQGTGLDSLLLTWGEIARPGGYGGLGGLGGPDNSEFGPLTQERIAVLSINYLFTPESNIVIATLARFEVRKVLINQWFAEGSPQYWSFRLASGKVAAGPGIPSRVRVDGEKALLEDLTDEINLNQFGPRPPVFLVWKGVSRFLPVMETRCQIQGVPLPGPIRILDVHASAVHLGVLSPSVILDHREGHFSDLEKFEVEYLGYSRSMSRSRKELSDQYIQDAFQFSRKKGQESPFQGEEKPFLPDSHADNKALTHAAIDAVTPYLILLRLLRHR